MKRKLKRNNTIPLSDSMSRIANVCRSAIPWAVALFCSGAFVLLAFTVVMDARHTNTERVVISEQKKIALPRPALLPPSLSDRLITALGLVPMEAEEMTLVAAMIENHVDAREAQRGLKEASMIIEMFVEGDITRFLALYRSDRLPAIISPIRSLRPHFITMILPYRPLLLHAGGSPIAYELLRNHPNIVSHDGIRYDGQTFERDPKYHAPHNLVIKRDAILEVLKEHPVPSQSLPLIDSTIDLPDSQDSARHITVDYKSLIHDVRYAYDIARGTYVRSTEGADRQAEPRTVIFLETYMEGVGDPGILPWTKTFGSGRMLLFTKGRQWEGSWKRDAQNRIQFFDENGISISPPSSGQLWISFLPTLNRVEWE